MDTVVEGAGKWWDEWEHIHANPFKLTKKKRNFLKLTNTFSERNGYNSFSTDPSSVKC